MTTKTPQKKEIKLIKVPVEKSSLPPMSKVISEALDRIDANL